ncbi:MAG: TldD/PmbA family protein [Euryarchaeota archaeon]|nr:TldD/PmbA family protein [Euryarchaeota archaeon]
MLREVGKLLELPARFVDVTIYRVESTTIVMKDGSAREVSTGESFGACVRVLRKGWGFAYASSARELAERAEQALRGAELAGERVELAEVEPGRGRAEVRARLHPSRATLEEKLEYLHRASEAASGYARVVSTSFAYSDASVEVTYLSSEGAELSMRYPRVAFHAQVFAKEGARLQFATERAGATSGLEVLEDVEVLAEKACEKAERLLRAKAPPSGEFKVVIDPKLTGVFIHEALGHAVEADHVVQGESILGGMLGQRIASELVTVYDDPTLEGGFGSYFYDAEGVRARRKAVVEQGVLRSYLHTRETAARLGQEPTGNARAQGYSYPPLPRMSNTYLAQGDSSFEELLEDIEYGVYLLGSRGGEVDTARGVFQFSAEEGFLIERGELTTPLRDVALSGETLEILRRVEAVGSGKEVHIGYCGKNGQLVAVGDGGPAIRTIATVGGTS